MDPYCLLPPDPDEPALPALDARTFAVLPGISALEQVPAVAVALSGGPDSMALCALVAAWAGARIAVHAITVDHALRPESTEEARLVGQWVSAHCPGVTHVILRRDPDRIAPTRLQEDARHDRYDLMTSYCREHDIHHLLLAHHQDDQAETFLFRLCKGSGLDGLAAMKHETGGDVKLIRPFLDVPKAVLLETCAVKGLPFVRDPSNRNDRFARVRLRQVMELLAREGLSAKRLTVTAMRLARARNALEQLADQAWSVTLRQEETGKLVFSWDDLMCHPDDIRIRILMRALRMVAQETGGYGPRLERVEELAESMATDSDFTRTTLHHCLIEKSAREKTLTIRREIA